MHPKFSVICNALSIIHYVTLHHISFPCAAAPKYVDGQSPPVGRHPRWFEGFVGDFWWRQLVYQNHGIQIWRRHDIEAFSALLAFVREIHQCQVDFFTKVQWCRHLMFPWALALKRCYTNTTLVRRHGLGYLHWFKIIYLGTEWKNGKQTRACNSVGDCWVYVFFLPDI